MTAASWDHGFYSNSVYQSGYYQQMAPNWIDFAVLAQGQIPPRPDEGTAFKYLDLGCGMGSGLCLLAALYPEGEFVGIDFLPDHIAYGQWLAAELGLTNVRFVEADLLALQHDPTPLGFSAGHQGPYHYVCSHGVATWVTEPVQRALFAVAGAALIPGGLFFCYYTTMPGWLGGSVIHQLVEIERKRHEPTNPAVPLQQAMDTLQSLLGSDSSPSPLATALPNLGKSLKAMSGDDHHTLITEYANQGWCPLYVAEMHRRVSLQKLSFVASAYLPNSFLELYPAAIREVVKQEVNPGVRETLLDLAVNASARSDIFVKGRLTLSGTDWRERISQVRFCIQEALPVSTYTFPTSFGTISETGGLYKRIEAPLTSASMTLLQWSEAARMPIQNMLSAAAMLLQAGRIGLERGQPSEQASRQCKLTNNKLLKKMQAGNFYCNHLGSPKTGNGVRISRVESFIMEGVALKLQGSDLHAWVLSQLGAHGIRYRDPQNQPFPDSQSHDQALNTCIDTFVQTRWPFLEALSLA